MSQNTGTVYAEMSLDIKKYKKGFRDAKKIMKKETNTIERKMKTVSRNLTRIGAGMSAAITAPMVMMGKKMFDAAVDAEQIQSKYEVIFGDLTKSADKFVNRLGNMGWDEIGIKNDLAEFQDFLVPMGLAEEQALDMSKAMTQLAIDVGSLKKDISMDQVKTAIKGGLRGETEGAANILGSNLKVAKLEREALQREIIKTGEKLTEEQKIMLRSILMVEDSVKAHNDFQNTSHQTANQIDILKEQWKKFKRLYGEPIEDAFRPLVIAAKDFLFWLNSLDENTKVWIVRLGALIGAIGPVVLILGQFLNALIIIKGAITAVAGSAVIGKLMIGLKGLAGLLGGGLVGSVLVAAGAIAGLLALFTDFIGIRSALFNLIKNLVLLIWDLYEAFKFTAEALKYLVTGNIKAFNQMGTEAEKIVNNTLSHLKELTLGTAKEIKDGWNRDINGMKTPGEGMFPKIKQANNQQGGNNTEGGASGSFDYEAFWKKQQEKAKEAVEKTGETTTEIQEETDEANTAILNRSLSNLELFKEQLTTKTEMMRELFSGIQSSMTDSFTQGLTAIVDGTKSTGDAIRDTFTSIISSLKNMIIKFIAQKAVMTFLNFLLPGAGTAASAIGSALGVFHDGGIVPGTKNQDVPIIAQAGEYVLQPEQLSALMSGASKTENQSINVSVGDIYNNGQGDANENIVNEIMRKIQMNNLATGRL